MRHLLVKTLRRFRNHLAAIGLGSVALAGCLTSAQEADLARAAERLREASHIACVIAQAVRPPQAIADYCHLAPVMWPMIPVILAEHKAGVQRALDAEHYKSGLVCK